MFFPPNLTPEQIALIVKNQKSKETFEEYYQKRLSEEYTAFAQKPSFSLKTMMVMSKLPELVKERCRKEYYGSN